MPRPISWLPQLHAIERSVQNSVRSHYERRDLEQLFSLQPRAAQLLMDALPTVPIGRSRLVEREALRSLLAEIRQAEDPSGVLEAARRQGKAPSRRKLRELLPHDHPPAAGTRCQPASISPPARSASPTGHSKSWPLPCSSSPPCSIPGWRSSLSGMR